MSDQGQGNDEALRELAGFCEKYERELDHLPLDDPRRGPFTKVIVEANRVAGWPRPRRVTFVPPDLRATLAFSVRVVARRTGARLEVTQDAERTIREVEEQNNGNLPLTEEEFAALRSADEAKVVALAREPSSNWHHFFTWDDEEAGALARFVRMFGDGN